MTRTQVPGAVIGTAGGSLVGAGSTWAKNEQVARAGKQGEELTARVLNRLAVQPGGPTVLHDLRIPIPGFVANIDHVVVSGRTITLLDSKTWKPGFYWTFGATRRGITSFPFGDKKTLPTAKRALASHLQRAGVDARFRSSILVVWPSFTTRSMSLWAFRPQDAIALTGTSFERRVSRLVGHAAADPRVVAALRTLVH